MTKFIFFMAATKDKILEKALALFNEKGIEYVGMRELAAALSMRIGNLTYYFATKDELVFRLSEQYSASNSAIHAAHPVNGLYDFLKKQELIFNNMLRYRCLMLSMVHLMEQNPLIAASYEKVRAARGAGLEQSMKKLEQGRFLDLHEADDHRALVSVNSLLGRFWMSEAALSGKRSQLEKQMPAYLKVLAHLFRPYATKKGSKEIDLFLADVQ